MVLLTKNTGMDGVVLTNHYDKSYVINNDKYEFAKSMRLQFMKATCKHPIEWDKRLFNCEKIEKDYNNYLPKEYLNSSEHQEILNRIIVNN